MGCVSIPIIAAITDSIGAAGAALGAGATVAADVGAPLALAGATAPLDVGSVVTGLGMAGTTDAELAAGFGAADATGSALSGLGSALTGATSDMPALGSTPAMGAGVPGSLGTSLDTATAPGTAVASGAAPGVGAPAGSVVGAAAPASAAAAPSATGEFGLGDSSLTGAGGGAGTSSGLTGDTAASALGTSSAPTGLAAAPGAAAPATTAAPGAEVAGALGPGAKAGADVLGMLKSYGPLALSAGGLLSSVLQGDKKPAYQGQVSAEAAQMSAQGQELQSYLTSGTLPPGVSAGLSSAHDSAAATIRSQYASRGQTGSSAEAQDLANLSQTTVSQGAQIATNLLQQGVSESEFSAQLYQSLMDASIKQDAALSASIANFAGGMAGMGLKAVG